MTSSEKLTHRSPIFALAHNYTEENAKFSPMAATRVGIPGYEDKLDDFSHAAGEVAANFKKKVYAELGKLQPIDDIDRIAKAVMQERLAIAIQLHDAGEMDISFSVLRSPVNAIRGTFEAMKHATDEDFSNITHRLLAIDGSLQSWRSRLETAAKQNRYGARRQGLGVAAQLKTHSEGNYQKYALGIDPDKKYSKLHEAAIEAEQACALLHEWFESSYIPLSNPQDAVGEKSYKLWARYSTGADLNLKDIYDWGIADLAAINNRMWRAAAKLKPNATSLREVADYLEVHPDYVVEGEEELVRRLSKFIVDATAQLDGVHFDIDNRIKNCEARLAPAGSASAAYYTSPSEDLSRPGITWYPTMGKKVFGWWHIVSTWYHEAVPGHHLQSATATLQKDRLSRFQRNEAWVSGYGEGWALYAERLMDELGGFTDPGLEMGYLSGQALRAARIVVDIGMHLGYKDFDGNVWNADSAYELLLNRALLPETSARSEVERYLGWPGQAISYKVGERYWLKAREDAKNRLGEKFVLKDFHNFALKIGPMGLDPFMKEMAEWSN